MIKKAFALLVLTSVVMGGCQASENQPAKPKENKKVEQKADNNIQNPANTPENTPNNLQFAVPPINAKPVVIKDLATRPVEAPEDLPSLVNAGKFNMLTVVDTTNLNFTIDNKDFKSVCKSQIDLLTAKNWKETSTDLGTVENSKGMMKSFVNGTANLSLNCELVDDKTMVNLIKRQPPVMPNNQAPVVPVVPNSQSPVMPNNK